MGGDEVVESRGSWRKAHLLAEESGFGVLWRRSFSGVLSRVPERHPI